MPPAPAGRAPAVDPALSPGLGQPGVPSISPSWARCPGPPESRLLYKDRSNRSSESCWALAALWECLEASQSLPPQLMGVVGLGCGLQGLAGLESGHTCPGALLDGLCLGGVSVTRQNPRVPSCLCRSWPGRVGGGVVTSFLQPGPTCPLRNQASRRAASEDPSEFTLEAQQREDLPSRAEPLWGGASQPVLALSGVALAEFLGSESSPSALWVREAVVHLICVVSGFSAPDRSNSFPFWMHRIYLCFWSGFVCVCVCVCVCV